MRKNSEIVQTLATFFVIVACAVFFIFFGVDFMQTWTEPALYALGTFGKSIAGVAGSSGFDGLITYLIGNCIFIWLVLMSTKAYSFMKGLPRLVRISLTIATILAGFSLMVIQAGFDMGFPLDAIDEFVRFISKIVIGCEGVIICFAPLYSPHKRKAVPDYKDL